MTPRLIVVTDTTVVAPRLMVERIECLLRSAQPWSVMVQLRDRDLPIRERFALGRRLREITRAHGQALCVNDRVDLARLLDADGVHLGERSVDARDVRAHCGKPFWISVACHDPEGNVSRACDAELFSPICAPRKGVNARGPGALARRKEKLGKNTLLYALGGVNATHAPECIEYGADGVAAIGAAISTADATPLLAALGIRSC